MNGSRVLDFTIYIGVGLLVVASVTWSANDDRFGLTSNECSVWLGGVV